MEDVSDFPNSPAQTPLGDDDDEFMMDAVRELEELKRTKLFLEAENNRLKTQINQLTGESEGVDIAMSAAQAYMVSYENSRETCIDNIEKLIERKECLINDINALRLNLTSVREDRESTATLNETLKNEFNEIVEEKSLVVKRLSAINRGLKEISADKGQRLPNLKWYDAILKKIYSEFVEAQNRMEVSMVLKKK
jgi:chromosome segregation ATPase